MGKTKLSKNSTAEVDKENVGPVSRKRAAEDPCHGHLSRKTRMKWDVDPNLSNHIYNEMGVEPLSSAENSLDSMPLVTEKTPALNLISEPKQTVPQAPRVLQERQNRLVQDDQARLYNPPVDTSKVNTLEGILRNDDNFLCRRVKDVYEDEDHFGRLSDEMILNVFRWLPKFVLSRCSRVCKRWSSLVLDESLWKRIDLADKFLKAGVLGKVLNRGVHILRLTRAEIMTPLFTHTGFTSAFRTLNMCKVQYLDLSMADISTEGLSEMFGVCRDLKKISLENCVLNDTVCRHIGENVYLETLNLCMCQGISTEGLIGIAGNCKQLESINLAWTSLSRETLMYLVMCLPQTLCKLNLSGCREKLLDEDVSHLVDTCPHLKEIDLSDATALTCNALHHIANNLHGLEYVALSRCYHIMPASLPVLTKIVTLLAVDMFGMLREAPLQQLRESMPRIEINKFPFSSIARPTTGIRRTSLWGMRVRDTNV
ncbi:S-phase kinase-associated protein 2-like [Liolophura sinensis]|uniref:S-phase kinase-associated protein 2-like n=1 Tax=Liolophura sinensis TaxID=3198878 RepID=UPI00315943EA